MLPGARAATEAEARKRAHYSDLPDSVSFTPVAIETTGGIGDSSFIFLKELGRRIAEETEEKLAFKYLRQRLALAIQRGNAACVLEAINS